MRGRLLFLGNNHNNALNGNNNLNNNGRFVGIGGLLAAGTISNIKLHEIFCDDRIVKVSPRFFQHFRGFFISLADMGYD